MLRGVDPSDLAATLRTSERIAWNFHDAKRDDALRFGGGWCFDD